MNKDLIDLQRNSKATCVIIENKNIDKLSPSIILKASENDYLSLYKNPPFSNMAEIKSHFSQLCYLIITDITDLTSEEQNAYIGLVKDREVNGYKLPDNFIIVFTINDSSLLSKVSKDLYHFAVVAI